MPSAEERFRTKIERRRGHDVWTGATDQRGVGMVRIDGKLRTVQRAAWEFAYGPLPTGARVNSCATERACVRIDHLSLMPTALDKRPTRSRRRRRQGGGSLREMRPGVWEIAATEGRGPSGGVRRRYLRVQGDRGDAEIALEALVHATTRTDLGDLRVRELVDRYIDYWADGAPTATPVDSERAILRRVIEPALGSHLAALLTTLDVETILRRSAKQGTPTPEVRDALRLLGSAYQWAHGNRWCDESPTSGVTARDIID